jgi:hypothetical protein
VLYCTKSAFFSAFPKYYLVSTPRVFIIYIGEVGIVEDINIEVYIISNPIESRLSTRSACLKVSY